MPIAVTLNEAPCPAVTMAFFGCAVMVGATDLPAGLTVRIALPLVTVPAAFVTTTLKVSPLLAALVAAVV